jgi:hypothetical protein
MSFDAKQIASPYASRKEVRLKPGLSSSAADPPAPVVYETTVMMREMRPPSAMVKPVLPPRQLPNQFNAQQRCILVS